MNISIDSKYQKYWTRQVNIVQLPFIDKNIQRTTLSDNQFKLGQFTKITNNDTSMISRTLCKKTGFDDNVKFYQIKNNGFKNEYKQLLNKINDVNFERLFDLLQKQLLDIQFNEQQITEFILFLINKAVKEYKNGEVYVKLCKFLINFEIKHKKQQGLKIKDCIIKKILVKSSNQLYCQILSDPYNYDDFINFCKQKQRCIGIMYLVVNLYKYELLKFDIIQSVITDLSNSLLEQQQEHQIEMFTQGLQLIYDVSIAQQCLENNLLINLIQQSQERGSWLYHKVTGRQRVLIINSIEYCGFKINKIQQDQYDNPLVEQKDNTIIDPNEQSTNINNSIINESSSDYECDELVGNLDIKSSKQLQIFVKSLSQFDDQQQLQQVIEHKLMVELPISQFNELDILQLLLLLCEHQIQSVECYGKLMFSHLDPQQHLKFVNYTTQHIDDVTLDIPNIQTYLNSFIIQ